MTVNYGYPGVETPTELVNKPTAREVYSLQTKAGLNAVGRVKALLENNKDYAKSPYGITLKKFADLRFVRYTTNSAEAKACIQERLHRQ